MVDFINIAQNIQSNPFSDVTKRTSQDSYWVTKPAESKNSNNLPDEDTLLVEDIFRDKTIRIMTPEEARKTNNTKLIGISIASATILSAAGIFFLLRGGSKGLSKNFRRLQDFLDTKLQNSKLNSQYNTTTSKTVEYMNRKIEGALKRFEIINNYRTIKDLLFKNLMFNKYTAPVTGKMYNYFTVLFRRLARRTVVNSYKQTDSKFKSSRILSSTISQNLSKGDLSQNVTINGVTRTKSQWLTIIDRKTDELEKLYDGSFSYHKVLNRYRPMKAAMDKLEQYFEKKGLFWFWNKRTLTTFIAEDIIAKPKLDLQKQVRNHRKKITYSLKDLYEDSHKKVIDLTRSVDYADYPKITLLKGISQDFKNLKKGDSLAGGRLEHHLDSLKKEVQKSQRTGSMDSTTAEKLINGIEELTADYKNFKKGKVDEILDIYKELLSEDEYNVIRKSYAKSVKSLDKSINIETEEFVSKLRDLVLGSAPTDVLSVLAGFATLGYSLGKSDNAQERMSVGVKYGIPALAGIGTSFYFNAKLYAGVKSIAYGALSSIIVGVIGNKANKLLLDKFAQKEKANSSN